MAGGVQVKIPIIDAMKCVPTLPLSRTHTKEKTGVLRAERLRDALLEVGL